MSEIITAFLLSNPDEAIPMDRDEFYGEQIAEFEKTGKPTRSAAIVQMLLFTPDGDLILQKRSYKKNHNPGLIDKTMGGHITFGNTPTYTAMTETLQELSVPSFILDSKEDFSKTLKLLRQFIASAAIVQHVDTRTANFTKIFQDGRTIEIANTYFFYLGVYGGSVRPADKEATGILFYPFRQIENEMGKNPKQFTHDLRFFLSKYSKKIQEFLSEADAVLTK